MEQIVRRLYNLVRPAQGPVLLEQLKLVTRHQVSGAAFVGVVVILMWWMLSDQVNLASLSVWALLMVSGLLVTYSNARTNLRGGIASERAPAIVRRMVLERLFYGVGWGGLGFLALGSVESFYSFLVLSTIAGVTSSTMSAFAPVLLLFVITIVPTIALITFKVFLLGDPAFYAFGVTFVVYVFALLGQAFQSSQETRAAIDLRFENIDLLHHLNAKTKIAEGAQREAEHANAAKSMFLASASHDLRQPIHAQGLFLDVLSRTPLDQRQRELLNATVAAREASSEMLNTLLDFSRIEAGVIEPRIQAFNVQPILNKIEREFFQQADSKGLSYRSRESSLAVVSDPSLVELILRNLVSNAVKYTREGGLLVNVRRKGAVGVFEVWDTGVGIDPSQQESIFKEFHQLENPERDRSNGLGLGLAIAQGLAYLLGSAITLQSVPQRGSVFRLEVSLATDDWQPTRSVAPSVHAIPWNPVLPNVRVLVLDDDPVICRGMVQLLNDWGCACEASQSIEEAIQRALTFRPDIVVSDYRLREDSNGIEAIFSLRTLLGNTLPALLITGDTGPDQLRDAMASGIPVLHKPVSSSQLFHALTSALPEEMTQ